MSRVKACYNLYFDLLELPSLNASFIPLAVLHWQMTAPEKNAQSIFILGLACQYHSMVIPPMWPLPGRDPKYQQLPPLLFNLILIFKCLRYLHTWTRSVQLRGGTGLSPSPTARGPKPISASPTKPEAQSLARNWAKTRPNGQFIFNKMRKKCRFLSFK